MEANNGIAVCLCGMGGAAWFRAKAQTELATLLNRARDEGSITLQKSHEAQNRKFPLRQLKAICAKPSSTR
jgi:hypothetical protein